MIANGGTQPQPFCRRGVSRGVDIYANKSQYNDVGGSVLSARHTATLTGGETANREAVMNRWAYLFAVVVAVALASPLMAGEGHTCTHATQECLDYMAANLKDRGWVGIEMDDSGDYMVITKVVDGSPAEKAGFKKGDMLLAVNGVEFAEANKDKLKEVQGSMKPGVDMTYTLKRGAKKKELDVTLAKIPDTVVAQWVGKHMVDDHAEIKIASK